MNCTASPSSLVRSASARCKVIALELVELFRANEMHFRHPHSSVVQRVREAAADAVTYRDHKSE
jgi:hypothetical protein